MHSDAKLYYAMLGLPPTATEEAIRTAFRRRAKELHPDAPSGNAGAFIRLKRAYDTLSNPTRRASYDRACSRAGRRRLRPDLVPPAPPRPGGIGFVRYLVATIIMAGLSFGFIEGLITYTTPPVTAARLAPIGPSLLDRPSARPNARPESREVDATRSEPADADADVPDPPRRRDPAGPSLGAWPGR